MRLWELQDAFLPSPILRDNHAAEGAAINRNPQALILAYNSLSEPDEETGEAPPDAFVRRGMGEFTRLLAQAAEEAGVKIHTNQAVGFIIAHKGSIAGIQLVDGSDIICSKVVSNLDPKRTFLKLLAPDLLANSMRRRVEALTTDVSCLKLLAVIDELPEWKAWDGDPERPHRGAVRLGVSRHEVEKAYDDLEAGRPPASPILSFNMPSYQDASLTQPGCQTASIWIFPAPANLRDESWDDCRERVAENLIDRINTHAPNFRRSIRSYKLRTPLDLERENGLSDGCIWHIQHRGSQLFWNRPLPELAHYRAPIKGLYMCGAGQHPGGEVSGLPGHNAAHEILKDIEK